MFRSIVCLLLALALAPSSGWSELRTKTNALYFTGFAGASWMQDQVHHVDYDFEMGPIAGLSVGYKMACGFRLEAEYSYRYNRYKHIEIDSIHFSSGHGYWQTSSGLFNIAYDFWVPETYLTPYIGLGIGYANQRLISRESSIRESKTKNSLAWQAMLGLDYILNKCNRVGLGYRFFRGTAIKFNNHAAVLTWTFFP